MVEFFVSWVVPSQNVRTEDPQKIDFAHFWCKGTPWGVIQESQIFLLSGQCFGFYGGVKFWGPRVPLKLQPFFVVNRHSK